MTNEEAIKLLEEVKSDKDELAEVCIRALKATEWIPVEKDLPEYMGLYLVTVDKDVPLKVVTLYDPKSNHWGSYQGRVTAWCPVTLYSYQPAYEEEEYDIG